MTRLMAQLKNFGAGQSLTEISLAALLRDVIESRRAQSPAPHCQAVADTILVRANRDRLGSALEHIVHNAQDAVGKHGEVSVRLLPPVNGQAIVEVEDNGPGMDEDFIRTRLFKPFETTKGLTGMGIGAYESREYIRSLGGELLVKSTPGRGTVFRFIIPTVSTAAESFSNEVKTA
jgi:signal transduction histidine kinase